MERLANIVANVLVVLVGLLIAWAVSFAMSIVVLAFLATYLVSLWASQKTLEQVESQIAFNSQLLSDLDTKEQGEFLEVDYSIIPFPTKEDTL